MSKRLERIEGLLTLLRWRGSASVDELADHFRVSNVTIRRDLAYLARKHELRVFRGGAVFAGDRQSEEEEGSGYRLRDAERRNAAEKRRIASYAVGLIAPGDVVFIDAGTTTEHLVSQLPPDVPVTIVCYSANVLCPIIAQAKHKVISLGGVYHRSSAVFESKEAQALLERTRITKAFFSANGVEAQLGVTCSNAFEVPIKQVAIRSSLERYLLVDSSKFQKVQSDYFARAGDFTMIITNQPISPGIRDSFAEQGVEIRAV